MVTAPNDATVAAQTRMVTVLSMISAAAFFIILALHILWPQPNDEPNPLLLDVLALYGLTQAIIVGGISLRRQLNRSFAPLVFTLLVPFDLYFAIAVWENPGQDWIYGYTSLTIVAVGGFTISRSWWIAIVTGIWLSWVIPAVALTFQDSTLIDWRTPVIMGIFATFISFFAWRDHHRNTTVLKRIAESAVSDAHRDSLTGLLNREGARTEAEPFIDHALAIGYPVHITFVDMDGLKQINDVYGHDSGDAAIQLVADAIRANTRDATDRSSRWGGDEFVILSSGPTIGAIHLQERLNNWLTEHNPNSNRWAASVTVGMASALGSNKVSVPELVAEADRNMYDRKVAS